MQSNFLKLFFDQEYEQFGGTKLKEQNRCDQILKVESPTAEAITFQFYVFS